MFVPVGRCQGTRGTWLALGGLFFPLIDSFCHFSLDAKPQPGTTNSLPVLHRNKRQEEVRFVFCPCERACFRVEISAEGGNLFSCHLALNGLEFSPHMSLIP